MAGLLFLDQHVDWSQFTLQLLTKSTIDQTLGGQLSRWHWQSSAKRPPLPTPWCRGHRWRPDLRHQLLEELTLVEDEIHGLLCIPTRADWGGHQSLTSINIERTEARGDFLRMFLCFSVCLGVVVLRPVEVWFVKSTTDLLEESSHLTTCWG